MVNSNYRKGYVFELDVIEDLKNKWNPLYITRTPASHSPIDIIMITSDEIMLFQCKNKTISKKEKDDFSLFMESFEEKIILPFSAYFVTKENHKIKYIEV
jgi:hypothetical protein